jgi:hypothetical protein
MTIGEFLLVDRPERWVFRHTSGPVKSITRGQVAEALDRPFGVPAQGDSITVRQVNIDWLNLPSRVIGPLVEMRVRTVEELMGVERAALLACSRVGVVSILRVREELLDLLFPPVVALETLGTFESTVHGFIERAIGDPRRAALALGRLAPGAARPAPMASFGDELGLSRERIRQLVEDSYECLRKSAKLALLNPFWRAMWSILETSDAPVQLDQLADALQRRLNWPEAPEDAALERLCRLHPSLLISRQGVCINVPS